MYYLIKKKYSGRSTSILCLNEKKEETWSPLVMYSPKPVVFTSEKEAKKKIKELEAKHPIWDFRIRQEVRWWWLGMDGEKDGR